MTPPRTTVLVIEDEAPMRRFLCSTLESHGYRPIEAADARDGIAMAAQHNPELILLDLGLPDRDGLSVTRALREWSGAPILVISARGRESDKVEALDLGANDYLTKPFGMNELLARIRVALRSAAERGRPVPSSIVVGPLSIDLARHEVTVRGSPVHLTPIEYRLLVLLARHAGNLLTHRQILREIWGGASGPDAHHLRVHMSNLRRKIEEDPARPRLLLNEPGVGYRMRDLA